MSLKRILRLHTLVSTLLAVLGYGRLQRAAGISVTDSSRDRRQFPDIYDRCRKRSVDNITRRQTTDARLA